MEVAIVMIAGILCLIATATLAFFLSKKKKETPSTTASKPISRRQEKGPRTYDEPLQ